MKENLNFRRKSNYKSANKSIINYSINYSNEISYPHPIFKIDNIDSYSYMTSIIHLIYQISPIYKYYHNKINSKNDKFSIHLHNTLVYYNNTKKSDIPQDKKIIDITKLSTNLYNLNNKFTKNMNHDPVEFLQMIIKNPECEDNFYLKNIKIKDECECNESNIFFIEKIQNIFNIPVKNIIELSLKNNINLYSNNNRLFYFYKDLIFNNYLKKINCPLNGIDCNFNRVKRKIIISNLSESLDSNSNISKEILINKQKCLTENIFFNFQYIDDYNEIIHKKMNIFYLLTMIPFSFDISEIFEFEEKLNYNIYYNFHACILINNSNFFSIIIKLRNRWIYYNDNEEKVFLSYYQFIQYALKNNLFPYLLMYTYKNIGVYINDNIDKKQFEELYNYAFSIDEFKQSKINDKFQLFNLSKNEDDITLQQSSTECEEKKMSISYNYNNFNNSNTPVHITKNLELNSSNNNNLNEKSSLMNIKNSRAKELINNINLYSEKERSLDGIKKLENFKLSPLSSGNADYNLKDIQIFNNNKSLNLININENNNLNHMIHSAKVYPLQLTEEKIKLIGDKKNNNKMSKQMTDINLINSLNPPEMWICQNCNIVNKAFDFECRLCKIINKNQQEIIKIFRSLSINNEEDNYKNLLTTNNNINNGIVNKRIRAKSGRVFGSYKINGTKIYKKKVKCACYTEMKDTIIKNNICVLCGREIKPYSRKIINVSKHNNNFMNKTTDLFYGKKINNNKFHSQSRLIKTKSMEKIKIKHKKKNKIELINKDLFKEYQRKIKNTFSTEIIKE